MASPAVAGAASLSDLAGDVAVGVSSPAIARAASLADLAGDVTVGVISPASAGGGGGAASVDCGTFVVGRPASMFLR